ncbi:MAG: four helix bundle protein, partial [Croceimicrobium sp.]
MHRYKNLKVWQKAMDLTTEAYQLSNSIPEIERFGLLQQLRRAAISVPSNIAEGAGRASKREFLRFISIANGSLNELETQLILGERLGYLDVKANTNAYRLISEIQRMCLALTNTL